MLQGGEAAGLWEAAFLGLVEGLTEFLPISSTGHLIVAGRLVALDDPSLQVAMQLGAITAIVVLYRSSLRHAVRGLLGARAGDDGRMRRLLPLILVAVVPAGVLGIAFGSAIKEWLFEPLVVAWALIAGGVGLWALESWQRRRPALPVVRPEALGWGQALVIGLFQCLALVPGTSRSGACMAGGLVVGMERSGAAEFSFLMGLPVLYGASLLELMDDSSSLLGEQLPVFLVALGAGFFSALLVVAPFVAFLKRYTFVPFACYRIVFGALLLAGCAAGWFDGGQALR